MRKLIVLCLCLCLLMGCISVPSYVPETQWPLAKETRTPSDAAESVPATVSETTEAQITVTPAPTPAPTPTPTPVPTPTPTPTAPPTQTYSGTYFSFEAPGSWLRAEIQDGVYLYPDPHDIRHAYLLYQESPNDMKLTEASLDIALMFSSKETITAMVEGALTNSGMTDFSLSPMIIQKTKLNGSTCYKGASDITLGGETFDFVGYIFLRKDKMVLLIWVGDQTKHAAGLNTVYDSFTAIR